MRWLLAFFAGAAILGAAYFSLRERWTRPLLVIGIAVYPGDPDEEAVKAGFFEELRANDFRAGRLSLRGSCEQAPFKGQLAAYTTDEVGLPGFCPIPETWPAHDGALLVTPGTLVQSDVILRWAREKAQRLLVLASTDVPFGLSTMGYDPSVDRPPLSLLIALDAMAPGVKRVFRPGTPAALASSTLAARPDLVVLEHSSESDAADVAEALRKAGFEGPIFVSAGTLRHARDLRRLEGCDVVLAPLKTANLKEASRGATRKLIALLDERDSADLAATVAWLRSLKPDAFVAEFHAEPRVYQIKSGRLTLSSD